MKTLILFSISLFFSFSLNASILNCRYQVGGKPVAKVILTISDGHVLSPAKLDQMGLVANLNVVEKEKGAGELHHLILGNQPGEEFEQIIFEEKSGSALKSKFSNYAIPMFKDIEGYCMDGVDELFARENEHAKFAAAVFVQSCSFHAELGKEMCVILFEGQEIGPNADVELKLVNENEGYRTYAGNEERKFKYSSVPGGFVANLKVQKDSPADPKQHTTYSIMAEFQNTKSPSSLRKTIVTMNDSLEKINSVKLSGEPVVIGEVTYKPFLYLGVPFIEGLK